LDKHIRKIFSVFALGMIILFVMALQMGIWSPLNWAILIASAVCCLLVFKSFVYIFNLSYGLACVVNGSIFAIWFSNSAAILLGGAMVIYGLRLFLFTWFRMRSESYQPRVKNIVIADAAMPFGVKIALWVQCSFLYCFHLFAFYIAGQVAVINLSVVLGVAIILVGTVIEGVADAQKQNAKAAAPDTFVMSGLYNRWRHPNYTGEILVQLGLIVVGIGAVPSGWMNYAAVVISPLYIILLMVAECGRSDKYMALRYGDKEEFKGYLQQSSSMLPKF
jgi:steroid 5-alpha reductase family enzyme